MAASGLFPSTAMCFFFVGPTSTSRGPPPLRSMTFTGGSLIITTVSPTTANNVGWLRITSSGDLGEARPFPPIPQKSSPIVGGQSSAHFLAEVASISAASDGQRGPSSSTRNLVPVSVREGAAAAGGVFFCTTLMSAASGVLPRTNVVPL